MAERNIQSGLIYKRLRLRLTAWYILLSGLTCMALVMVGTLLCYKSITDGVDKSLEELIASNLKQVELKGDKLQFRFAVQKVSNEWAEQQSTVQLFDAKGTLLDQLGPPGVSQLELHKDYFEQVVGSRQLLVRGTSDPIIVNGRTYGYLQAQMPVEIRDKATREFAVIMGGIMPLLLVALGACGYLFSIKASKPAEQAFTLLKRFMADASHELRTPIHSIQLTAENVSEEAEQGSQLVVDMANITRSTDRMSKLIEDMMMLTKMDIQQLPFKSEPVRLNDLIAGAVDELRPAFLEKQISIQLGQLEPVIVHGDEDGLHRVLSNLLQNALRYTDSGGTVSINMDCFSDSARISVSDTGIGIAPEALPHLFERFYRAEKSRDRVAGGSGLGLSIAQAICQHHKGSISVDSQDGKGSTFTITLPCSSKTTTV